MVDGNEPEPAVGHRERQEAGRREAAERADRRELDRLIRAALQVASEPRERS